MECLKTFFCNMILWVIIIISTELEGPLKKLTNASMEPLLQRCLLCRDRAKSRRNVMSPSLHCIASS